MPRTSWVQLRSIEGVVGEPTRTDRGHNAAPAAAPSMLKLILDLHSRTEHGTSVSGLEFTTGP